MTTRAASATWTTGARQAPLVFALLAVLCVLGPRTARAHLLAAPAAVESYGGTHLWGMDLPDCPAVGGVALESPLLHREIAALTVGLAAGRVLPGQYYDSEAGFRYNWRRYYSIQTGRYMQTDSLRGRQLVPNGTYRPPAYSYSDGSPNIYTDPRGKCVFGLDTALCLYAAVAGIAAALSWAIANSGLSDYIYNNQYHADPCGHYAPGYVLHGTPANKNKPHGVPGDPGNAGIEQANGIDGP